jgi:hypothetical protein
VLHSFPTRRSSDLNQNGSFDIVMDAIRRLEQRFDGASINSADRRVDRHHETRDSSTDRHRSSSPPHQRADRQSRRVSFHDDTSTHRSPSRSPSLDRPPARVEQRDYRRQPATTYRRQHQACRNCDRSHGDIICYSCGGRGHPKSCCLTRRMGRRFNRQ